MQCPSKVTHSKAIKAGPTDYWVDLKRYSLKDCKQVAHAKCSDTSSWSHCACTSSHCRLYTGSHRHATTSCAPNGPGNPRIARQSRVYSHPFSSFHDVKTHHNFAVFAPSRKPPCHTTSHWATKKLKPKCHEGCSNAAVEFWGGESSRLMTQYIVGFGK